MRVNLKLFVLPLSVAASFIVPQTLLSCTGYTLLVNIYTLSLAIFHSIALLPKTPRLSLFTAVPKS